MSSHIYAVGQPISAALGLALPTVRVEFWDNFGITTDQAGLSSSNVPVVIAYTGDTWNEEKYLDTTNDATVGTWSNGHYVFSCLRFIARPNKLVTIKFGAFNVSNTLQPLGAFTVLESGFVSVTGAAVANYNLRFAPTSSLIQYPLQTASAVVGVALPAIRIELVDSSNVADTSDTGTVIAAMATSGELDPAGAQAVVVNGVATFTNLKFAVMGSDPALVFTATQTINPVEGRSIATGAFFLSTVPVSPYRIAFNTVVDANNMVTSEFTTLFFSSYTTATVAASIVILDSAHQRVTSLDSTTISVETDSDEALLDGGFLDFDTTTATANISLQIRGYNSGYEAGTPIFLSVKVTAGPALLQGQSLVIGPVLIEAVQSAASQDSCAANLVAPIVVAEYRLGLDVFNANQATIVSDLATALGIETSRVSFLSTRSITRRAYDGTGKWTGTAVQITFGNPTSTSATKLSSAQLAASLVEIRADCTSTGAAASNLGTVAKIESAYMLADLAKCDVDAFRSALADARACAAAGVIPACQCYSSGVISQYGWPCLETSGTAASLVSDMCGSVTTCSDADTFAVCEGSVDASGQNIVWVWVVIALAAAAAMAYLLLEKHVVRLMAAGSERLNHFEKHGGRGVSIYDM
jgi:hypothetical protein